MIAPALIIIIFAITCCGLALWAVVTTKPAQEAKPDPLAGMTPDAMRLVRRANRPWS